MFSNILSFFNEEEAEGKRFMIEDLTNGGVRYEETQAEAIKAVRFFHTSLKSDEIRLTDRKAGTWVDYRLNRNVERNSAYPRDGRV